MFRVNREGEDLSTLEEKKFKELDFSEPNDIEEWVVKNPQILKEDLKIISRQLSNFERIRDSLDLLALDKKGNLVIIELKRDTADRTTDLQAIKYASYLSTFSAKDIQKEYKDYLEEQEGEEKSVEDVGSEIENFLDADESKISRFDEGWAEFQVNNKPRIMLVAGDFKREVTTPVMWLIDEYGLDITCISMKAYTKEDEVLVNSSQIIPLPETEEFMARRREKQEEQEKDSDSIRTLDWLLNNGYLSQGDKVIFRKERLQNQPEKDDEYWHAEVTGKRDGSNNLKWEKDGDLYSFSGLASKILLEIDDDDRTINGYSYWRKQGEEKSLLSVKRRA